MKNSNMSTGVSVSLTVDHPPFWLETGYVVDSFLGEEGVNQGCVLAGLAYAFLFNDAYVAAAGEAKGLTAKAIVDDFTVVGPREVVFSVIDLWR